MKKEKRSNAVFYGLMGIMLGLFVISLIATGGKSIYQFLFYDRKDIFMDFINDCFSGDPYGKKCIYPPLTYVIYTIFSKFLPMDMAKKHGMFAVRDSAQGLTVYMIYTLIIVVIMLALIWKFLKGDRKKKLQFSVVTLMSMPVLYSFDRGNIVWFCMAFLMVYIFTYDNKNKILREIGLISLAIATSIKIYPVVFGLMLLFDKRWAEAKRCIIYGVLIFFVPFLCFGGFSEFTVLLSNLTNASNFLGSIGHEELTKRIPDYEAVVLCDLPAHTRNKILKFCFEKSIRIYVTPKLSDIIISGSESIHLFDTPLYLCRNNGFSMDQRIFKRAMDIIGSLIGIIILSPFMLLTAVAIKAYDRGPVFFKQARLTQDGREFGIIKFRSMCIESEKNGAQLAKKHDDRITPVGRLIRKIHFDEIPQLFNILKGDMSIVGPRPERQEIASQYEEIIPEFRYRLKVKAGLTGYAQVYGKYNTTPYDKLKLDMLYIENYSFWLDIKILLMTFKVILQKENSEGIDENQITALKREIESKTTTKY